MKTSSTLSRHLLESLWLPLLAVIVATCACNLFQAGPAASATEKPASAGEPTSQNPSSGGVQPTFPANQTTPDPYADRVVSFTPGNPASQCCNNPDSSLGPPDFNEATMSGWITLGIGGSITLEFTDNMAVNGNGSDIEIFGDPANDEQWTVEVSADGVNYKSFGMVSERASLDLAKVGLDSARFVRITDDGSPSKGGVSPGAELDAIQVLNSSTQGTNPQPPPEQSTPLVNQTTHGHIVRDEIWRGEIHITGDIFVDESVTLTIEPGTVVRIAANQDVENLFDWPFDMKIGIQNEVNNINGVHLGEPYRDEGHHISIRIAGTLQAVGTPEKMITITSESSTPGIYDWGHFEFAHGILSFSKVEYYRVLGPGNGTEVSHNILQHIGECGVCANSTVVVEYNTISYAGHELIDMHQSSPIIRNNSLGPNPDHAGIVIDGGSPQILNNTIIGCGGGINFISSPENPNLEGNIFKNNEQDIIYGY